MKAKLCFDISAMFIMLVVLAYNMRRKTSRGNKSKWYFAIVWFALFGNISAILNSSMVIMGVQNFKMLTFFDAIDNIFISLIAPVYIFYMILFTGNEEKLRDHIKLSVVILIPEILGIAYLMYYYYHIFLRRVSPEGDFMGRYHGLIFYLLEMFYVVVGVVYIRYLKKAVASATHFVLFIPMVLVSFSLTLRLFYKNSQSVFFVIAMSLLLLLLLNRAAMSLIDLNTGFKTNISFNDEMRKDQFMGREFKLILIKVINYSDTLNRYGYEEIEYAMKEIARQIIFCVEDNLIEGDEKYYDDAGSFIVSIPKRYYANVPMLAQDISKTIMQQVSLGRVDFRLLANVCVVSFPEDVPDADSVWMVLDDMGKMGHVLHPLLPADITDCNDFNIRRQMNTIIDRALKENNFSVYYQPIYDVKKKKFGSAEALIRLNDPEHGFISPGVFIPISEKTGAIHKIGSFVLEEVMRFISSEEFRKLDVDYIEINLSGAQCLRIDLADEITTLAQKYNVNPKCVNLEITETAECYSQDILQENIRTLHNGGYTFSLDDFGTGYSNLMRMASLPMDIIKLDRAFVIMDDNEKFHSIIKNMVRMFKQMGLKVLVEGIETQEMVDKFTDINVDYIQGFFYSKPLPKDDYISFIMEHND